jgi:hypothetical protein
VLRTLARRIEAATREAEQLEREILVRRQHDPTTPTYVEQRLGEGQSRHEATRLLKCYLARHLYRYCNSRSR